MEEKSGKVQDHCSSNSSTDLMERWSAICIPGSFTSLSSYEPERQRPIDEDFSLYGSENINLSTTDISLNDTKTLKGPAVGKDSGDKELKPLKMTDVEFAEKSVNSESTVKTSKSTPIENS